MNLRALPLATESGRRKRREGAALLRRTPDLRRLQRAGLGGARHHGADDAVSDLIESVLDRMLEYDEIELLAGDIVVDPEQLCRGIVLTTRVSEIAAWPPLETDLAGLSYLTDDFAEPPADVAPGQLLLAGSARVEVVAEPSPSRVSMTTSSTRFAGRTPPRPRRPGSRCPSAN